MDEPASDAGNEETVIDLQFDRVFQGFLLLVEHLIQALGLCYGAGKAIKNKSGALSANSCPGQARE